MKAIIALCLLFSPWVHALPIFDVFYNQSLDDLLENSAEFLATHTQNGLVFHIAYSTKTAAEILKDGLQPLTDSRTNLATALEYAESDRELDEHVLAVIPIAYEGKDVSLRILKYKKNRVARRLRKVAHDHGLSYTDRTAMWLLLAKEYGIDAVLNNEDELIILNPKRFRMLGIDETIHAYKTGLIPHEDANSIRSQIFKLKVDQCDGIVAQ